MNTMRQSWKGVLLCAALAVPSFLLGKQFPIIGGPVFAILIGMALAPMIKKKETFAPGIKFTSKKILQYAVILLGFGMNLEVVLETGKQSLPIILCTIGTSLIIAYILHRAMHIPGNISTLVGVGSSICGGSAIAATAPVIDADDEEVAQAISVIFLFNILAALIFPVLGGALGFSTTSGEAFGIFAGTAHACNHSDYISACFFAYKKDRRNRWRESVIKKRISVFYLVFYRGKCYYDSSDSNGSSGGNVCTFERIVKIFYHYGNGSHWIPYRCSKAYQKWRKADFHGTLLLDRNHDCFSCNAACDASLVKFL